MRLVETNFIKSFFPVLFNSGDVKLVEDIYRHHHGLKLCDKIVKNKFAD